MGGGNDGATAFQRPARFLPEKVETYPVDITRYTTMQQCVQNAFTGSGVQLPGYGNQVAGYQGFKPRCPPTGTGDVGWAKVSGRAA